MMLQFNAPLKPVENTPRTYGSAAAPEKSGSRLLASILRGRRVIALCTIAFLVCGVAYLAVAVPRFSAQAAIVIDMGRDQTLRRGQSTDSAVFDSSYVQTQVELLKSERVLLRAIRTAELLKDPDFTSELGEIAALRWIKGKVRQLSLAVFGAEDGPGETGELRSALAQIQGKLAVERAGLTSVIELRFDSHSPRLAARVTNAVVQAYIDDQVDAKHEAVVRAGQWLEERIQELRSQSSDAERAVQSYKTKNNIVETPRGRLNEQQLGELMTQLVIARAQTTEAQARLERSREALQTGPSTVVVSDVLRSEVVARLRSQFFELTQRENDLKARLGADHPLVLEVRKQVGDTRDLMTDEVRRVSEGIKSEYEIARARQQVLEAAVASSVAETGVANDAMLTLRNLESSAQSYRTIYDVFLRNYTETVQALSYRFAEARIITDAAVPLAKSSPKAKVVLPVAALLGLFCGVAFSVVRDHTRDALYDRKEVRDGTGYDGVGAVPRLRGRISPSDAVAYANRHGKSPFAESIRDVLASLQMFQAPTAPRILAVASARPGEGATTIAANLAQMLGRTGDRVLLVDGDMRTHSLSRALLRKSTAGLAEICAGKADVQDSVLALEHFDFLPSGTVTPGMTSSDVMGSSAMTRTIEAFTGFYSVIVIDLPPVLSFVDARVAMRLADSCLLVVESGQTSRDTVAAAADALLCAGGSIAGCVLNKT